MKSVALEDARNQLLHLRLVVYDKHVSTVGQRVSSPSVWHQSYPRW
jgi:hypothetical protein